MSGGFDGLIFSSFKDYVTGAVHYQAAIDGRTRAIVFGTTVAQSLALGEIFSGAEFFTLETSETRDYVITTAPDTAIVFAAEIEASNIAQLFFFEDTVATGGTSAEFADLNRNTKNTLVTTVAIDPTITDDGTQLPFETQLGFAGKGNDEFGGASGGGLLLANSTKYLMRVTSISAGNLINVNLTLTESAPRV